MEWQLESDQVTIRRRHGELWLLEYGVGHLALARYEGRTVTIVSPGLFAGVGSRIVLPNGDDCRIWDSTLLR
jgi:hypothetical protein